MKEPQSYKNHVRWFPPFHFVLTPLLLINLIYWIVRMVQAPGWDYAALILLGVSLILLSLVSRLFGLKNQDRIIRLEETLRYSNLLSPELAARAAGLRLSQIIALRFASDEELAELVERALNGEFEKPKDIKIAIREWRADYHRV